VEAAAACKWNARNAQSVAIADLSNALFAVWKRRGQPILLRNSTIWPARYSDPFWVLPPVEVVPGWWGAASGPRHEKLVEAPVREWYSD
jgi:hypothetical protein